LRDLHSGVSVALDAQMHSITGISTNGSDAQRSLGMTSADSSLCSSAFATADAGFEYLATAEHYRYLAKGIVGALHRGCLVLVTGNPAASSPMLAAALREAAAPRTVIELSCGPDLDCQTLFAGGSMRPDTPAPALVEEEPGRPEPLFPIFVLADADRLSDGQIEEFQTATQAMPPRPHGFDAGVLLAHSDFVTRAESGGLHLLDVGLAAHFRLQRLERDEVEAFIRHQLPPGEGADPFTAQRLALIAVTSGGDPAVVNRFARRMLAIEPDDSAPPAPRRYPASLKLLAGVVLCLGVGWLAASAFEVQHLDVLVGLVRDRILPRGEPAEASASIGAAPLPGPALSWSSPNLAAPPPSAASTGRTTPESMTTGAGYPDATPLAVPAPERATQPGADAPRLSADDIAAFVARGDALLAAGDIASARLFFERAADAGDGRAAMRMAMTYDGAFLDRAGLRSLRNDPERAAAWYRRARELGEGKANPPLGSLGTSTDSK
jgi:hypothetical protein